MQAAGPVLRDSDSVGLGQGLGICHLFPENADAAVLRTTLGNGEQEEKNKEELEQGESEVGETHGGWV